LFITFGMAAAAAAATEADFGLIGLTAVENARLTAYCDGSVAPAPCEITLEFHHISGRTLKQATLILQPGTGGFLDFSAAQSGIAGLVQIDPCWKVIRGAGFASLQVFDSFTQRTRLLINWGDRSTARTGDIDFGIAGLTQFDTARLSAFCEGDGSVEPSPCSITFEFHDLSGRVLKQTLLTLQPETGGFVDLRFAEAGTGGRRLELEPFLKVERGSAVGAFAIVDNFTGLTLVQAYPAALGRSGQ
jgi:hypothetical protein